MLDERRLAVVVVLAVPAVTEEHEDLPAYVQLPRRARALELVRLEQRLTVDVIARHQVADNSRDRAAGVDSNAHAQVVAWVL